MYSHSRALTKPYHCVHVHVHVHVHCVILHSFILLTCTCTFVYIHVHTVHAKKTCSMRTRAISLKSHRNETETARVYRFVPFRFVFVLFCSSTRLGDVPCGCTDASKTAMALRASSCTVATICHSSPTFCACDRLPKSRDYRICFRHTCTCTYIME